MIHLERPELLLLFLIIPALSFLRGRRGPAVSLRFSTLSIAKELAGPRVSKSGALVSALRFLALTLLIVAICRPQLVHGTTEVEASGVDIILDLDISGSMEALDFKLNGKATSRVDVVKNVVSKFISARPNDRIGIIAFAGRPYLASPLTLDHDWLLQRLGQIQIGSLEDGTAIGSALASASYRLSREDSKSKIIVLLTDGMNNAGKVSPITAAEAAKALGIKVYTIGAGTRGEAPMPATDAFGRKQLVMSKVDIDEKTLQDISAQTGGRYFRATDTDSLEQIYLEIDKLERTTRTMKKFTNISELFMYFAGSALMFLGLELFLQMNLMRRLP